MEALKHLRLSYERDKEAYEEVYRQSEQFDDENDVVRVNAAQEYAETKNLLSLEKEKADLFKQIKDIDIEEEERMLLLENTKLMELISELSSHKVAAKATENAKDLIESCLIEEEALVEPKYDSAAQDRAERRYEKKCDKLETIQASIYNLVPEITKLKENIKTKKEKIKEVQEANKLYEQMKNRNGAAKTLQKYLRGNRDRYISSVWDLFLTSASEFASNCTDGKISNIFRAEGGTFHFTEDEHAMSMRDASGAQEAIMGIAVQSALAESAQCPLDVLLVDEPTADMDAEHSLAVAGMLSTKGRQVIAISHREMDASICNNVITMEN